MSRPRGSRTSPGPRLRSAVIVTAAMVALIGLPSPSQARSGQPVSHRRSRAFPATAPGLISHDGRWLTDSQGRVVLLHGVNMVAKDLRTPDQRGFGADDAQWLQDNGFDAVRLGLSANALMPT